MVVERILLAGGLCLCAACSSPGGEGRRGAADAGVESRPDAETATRQPDARAADAAVSAPDAQAPDAAVADRPDVPLKTVGGKLRFKRYDQLKLELQRVLGLEASEVCNELDRFDCAGDVHRVALGGAKPYLTNVYEMAKEPPLPAPLAWERVVLTACAERVDRDLAAPAEAAWLTGLQVDGDGALDAESDAVGLAIDTLYKRALLREPTETERQEWRDNVLTVAATGEDSGRRWARILCAAVLSSTEFVVY